jgi:hypothetical protein
MAGRANLIGLLLAALGVASGTRRTGDHKQRCREYETLHFAAPFSELP